MLPEKIRIQAGERPNHQLLELDIEHLMVAFIPTCLPVDQNLNAMQIESVFCSIW